MYARVHSVFIGMHVEVRGQSVEGDSLLPQCRSQEWSLVLKLAAGVYCCPPPPAPSLTSLFTSCSLLVVFLPTSPKLISALGPLHRLSLLGVFLL